MKMRKEWLCALAVALAVNLQAAHPWLSRSSVEKPVVLASGDGQTQQSVNEKKGGIRYFDIVISYEGDRTQAQEEKFRKVLEHFAYGIYQMSQGQHKLREVKVYSKGVNANACDVQWITTDLRSNANLNGDPNNGTQRNMAIHISDVSTAGKFDLSDGVSDYEAAVAGSTLAHEWGHYQFGVYDEYLSAAKGLVFKHYDDLPREVVTDRSRPSIMSYQYYYAMMRYGSPYSNDWWKYLNFSTLKTVQDESNTKQWSIYGMSGWKYVSTSYKYAEDFWNVGPGMCMIPDLYDFQQMDWTAAIDSLEINWDLPLAVYLVLDQSGSMSGTPIANVRNAACKLVDILPKECMISVWSFDDGVYSQYATQVLGDNAAAVKSTINAIGAYGGTYIGKATTAVLNDAEAVIAQGLTSTPIVFLLSDGDSADDVLKEVSRFKSLNIPVVGFGYGSYVDARLSQLAAQTGGRYYFSPTTASAIQNAFAQASSFAGLRQSGASGTIAASAELSYGETEQYTERIPVDSTMKDLRMTISCGSGNSGITLQSPSGRQISPTETTTVGRETIYDFEVATPEVGEWTLTGELSAGESVSYSVNSAATADGYWLDVEVGKPSGVQGGRASYLVTASLRKDADIDGAKVCGRLMKNGVEVSRQYLDNYSAGLYRAYFTLEGNASDYTLSVAANNDSGAAVVTYVNVEYSANEDGTVPEPPADVRVGENFSRTIDVSFAEDVQGIVYVDAARSSDSGNGLSWSTAKKTIQAAVNVAAADGVILVRDGTYAPFSTSDKAVTIRSVNGADKTIIDGNGASRCADLGSGAGENRTRLEGFTLTNGSVGSGELGGGVRGGTLDRCRIVGNAAASGGGAYGSHLMNCLVTGNTAGTDAAGAVACHLFGCTVMDNRLVGGGSAVAGVRGGMMANTIVWNNTTASGAVNNWQSCVAERCCTIPLADGLANIVSDPQLTQTGSLSSASPCRDAGDPAWVFGDRDLSGAPHVMGTAPDIGAFECSALPGKPEDVRASDGLSMEIVSVIWPAQADATKYSVWRKGPEDAAAVCIASDITETFYLDGDIVANVAYEYSVRAENAAGYGERSDADKGWRVSEFSSRRSGFQLDAAYAEEGKSALVEIAPGDHTGYCSVQVFLTHGTTNAKDLALPKGRTFPFTVSWEAGDLTAKTIEIPIAADKAVEGAEEFYLQLANAEGMEIGENKVCTVTVRDMTVATSLAQALNSSDAKASSKGQGKWFAAPGCEWYFADVNRGVNHVESPALAQGQSSTLTLSAGKGPGKFVVLFRFTGNEKESVSSTLEIYGGNEYLRNYIHASTGNGWQRHTITDPNKGSHKYSYVFTQGSDPDAHVEFVGAYWVSQGEGDPVAVVVSANDAGKGCVTGCGTYRYGATAKITAKPNPGRTFSGWYRWSKANNRYEEYSKSANLTFKVTEETDLQAVFTDQPIVRVLPNPPDGGTVTGAGRYAAGKKVTLKAKANKGCVFRGWYDVAGALLSQDAKYTFTMPEGGLSLTAAFVTAAEDLRAISLTVAGVAADAAQPLIASNVCGVAVNWPLVPAGLSATTVKAAGLPAGVKLVQDKKTKVWSISGVPTKIGPYTAKLTVTTAAKNSQVFLINGMVTVLPGAAVGTFYGLVSAYDESIQQFYRSSSVASAVLTTTGIGGIALKLTTGSGAVSLTQKGWTELLGRYCHVELKSKKDETVDLYVDTQPSDWTDFGHVFGFVSGGSFGSTSYYLEMQRSAFAKSKAGIEHPEAFMLADSLAGTYWFNVVDKGNKTYEIVPAADKSAQFSVNVKSSGAVQVSGKIAGMKISAATELRPHPSDSSADVFCCARLDKSTPVSIILRITPQGVSGAIYF